MAMYYEVTSTFDNRGKVFASITANIQANEKPESTFVCGRTKDIYKDYFASKKEADQFVKDAYNA